MKNLVTCLAILFTAFTFGQSKVVYGNANVVNKTAKIENISFTVNVDSAEEIESSFKIENIEELIKGKGENETFSFKVVCNKDQKSNGIKSQISYEVEGNSDDTEGFLRSIAAIKKAAINYYNHKN